MDPCSLLDASKAIIRGFTEKDKGLSDIERIHKYQVNGSARSYSPIMIELLGKATVEFEVAPT